MTVRQALGFYFGHNHFRLNQEVIVNQILAGRDVCAILPTGAGKSICYQLPALMLTGTTLVVSPLIALMRDQVTQLQNRGIKAEALTSGQLDQVQTQVLTQFAANRVKLFYVSPERLAQLQFLSVCQKVNINLVVIDEAHCISQWGHDFRPEYRQIAQFICSLATRPTVVALTATATAKVAQDLITNLGLQHPFLLRASVVKPNLAINIYQTESTNIRLIYLLRLLKKFISVKVIVYCQTRRLTQQLATLIHLVSPELNTLSYHAGLSDLMRQQVEKDFRSSQTGVVFATTAFGMGVDLPDIRAVIHYGLPANIEQYYQEIGRAGRDGLPSVTYLLTHRSDSEVVSFLNHSASTLVAKNNQQRFLALIRLANSPVCRMVKLAQYFGENKVQTCGRCDRCLPQLKQHILVKLLEDPSEKNRLAQLLKLRTVTSQLTDSQICWLAVTHPQSAPAMTGMTGFSPELSGQLWPIVQSFMVK